MSQDTSLTYQDAGVNIEAGNALVDRIKPAVAATRRPEVLGGLGGFGALFELPLDRYKKPVLVSGTDGVGTKLRLAIDAGIHDTVGIDLVAMCVNDIVVSGAEPLFFLDYYATGKLDVDTAAAVVTGIAEGCRQSGAALVGGETAEMPGMYEGDDYDLAGFTVGIIDKDDIIDGSAIAAGNVILGLASSGPHSNGYSLIRKLVADHNVDINADLNGQPLIQHLLAPTRIYVKQLRAAMETQRFNGLVHITGGGYWENIPRILPEGIGVELDYATWDQPAVFDWLATTGNINRDEMLSTFNCGLGMLVIVDADQAEAATEALRAQGETVFNIGHTTQISAGDDVVVIK